MRTIQITNTLTGKKETLATHEPGHVKMYACGVTVYDDCHIGHAMQAIYFDVIRSYLEYAGYKVTYTRNYTDVDGKIINRAKEQGRNPRELADSIIASSERDMNALGVRPATYEPKVSETIPEIVAMIETLIAKGAAYPTADGDVYYRVRSKADYGKLSNRKPDELRSGTRELSGGDKEDELDFALWKADDVDGASWESPWGRGRPGWHIECSAMARKFLGEELDIHGGGRDLVFPHHENEIAQSEAATGKKYASFWLHSGLLTIDKQKMSKSLGNHILIRDFLEKWPAEVLRLAYLQQHYRSNTDFSQAVFQSCARRLLYFYETLASLDQIADGEAKGPYVEGHDPDEIIAAFHANMSDDFNTVAALRDLHLAFRRANELGKLKKSDLRARTAKAYAARLREAFGVLGLLKEEPAAFMVGLKMKVLPELGITREEIERKIEERNEARRTKDFAKSDAIRSELAGRGIEIMDSPEGTKWSIRLDASQS